MQTTLSDGQALATQPTPQLTREITSDRLLIEAWLHARSPHTQRAYASDIRRLAASLAENQTSGVGKSLHSISVSSLQTFADTLSHLGPATRYRILSAVKSLLAFAFQIGYLPFDIGRVLRLPAVKNRLSERILTEADVLRLLQSESNPRNRLMLFVLYSAGIRVQELCSLCWRDVAPNGASGQITVFGKGGSTRSILLPPDVWNALDATRPGGPEARDQPVFRSRKQGRALLPGAVRDIVKRAAHRVGIRLPISPHWLRHAHASHALDHGAPIHLVQATLGHANLNTTGRYLHARPQDSSGMFLNATFLAERSPDS